MSFLKSLEAEEQVVWDLLRSHPGQGAEGRALREAGLAVGSWQVGTCGLIHTGLPTFASLDIFTVKI